MDLPTSKAKTKTKAAPAEPSYEQLMEELTGVITVMENASASLEEQLAQYERGMELCRKLEDRLKAAEEKILIINRAGEEEAFE